MMLNVSKVRWIVLAVSSWLYVASFFLPAILFHSVTQHEGTYVSSGGMQVYYGSSMALASVFGPLSFNFAGVANPLWIIGCVLLIVNRLRPARICFLVAACLALQTFQLRFEPLPYDEGGVAQGLLARPLIGWYAWFTALLLPLLCSFWRERAPRVSASHI